MRFVARIAAIKQLGVYGISAFVQVNAGFISTGNKKMKKTRARIQRLKALNARYATVKTINNHCVYCGDVANTVDHVPCLEAAFCLGSQFFVNSGISLEKYPACVECNVHLGNMFLHKIKQRAAYLYEKYQSKYKKVLDTPDWDKEEIEEMGRSLKKSLEDVQAVRTFVKRRLLFMREIYGFQ